MFTIFSFFDLKSKVPPLSLCSRESYCDLPFTRKHVHTRTHIYIHTPSSSPRHTVIHSSSPSMFPNVWWTSEAMRLLSTHALKVIVYVHTHKVSTRGGRADCFRLELLITRFPQCTGASPPSEDAIYSRSLHLPEQGLQVPH